MLDKIIRFYYSKYIVKVFMTQFAVSELEKRVTKKFLKICLCCYPVFFFILEGGI